MPDILQDLPIRSGAHEVFRAVSEPQGLDHWWTKTSRGSPSLGATYELGFGPDYQWSALVTKYDPGRSFELTLRDADSDWLGTRVGFELSPSTIGTQLRFHHRRWPRENEHYRISCHCWALYLRLLRRYVEHDESVPYEQRLDA